MLLNALMKIIKFYTNKGAIFTELYKEMVKFYSSTNTAH